MSLWSSTFSDSIRFLDENSKPGFNLQLNGTCSVTCSGATFSSNGVCTKCLDVNAASCNATKALSWYAISFFSFLRRCRSITDRVCFIQIVILDSIYSSTEPVQHHVHLRRILSMEFAHSVLMWTLLRAIRSSRSAGSFNHSLLVHSQSW